MPALTASAPTVAAAPPKAGKRKRLLLLGLVVGLLAVGLLVVKPMLSGPKAKEDLTKKPGAVVTLDPITLNLADGRFLKAGLALQLTEAATRAHSARGADGASAPPTAATYDGAKALDAAISILGSRSYAQLLAPGGRAKAEAELGAEIAVRYDHEVMRVYFTQLVMQ